MFCGNCGKEVYEGAKFCPNCGALREIAADAAAPKAKKGKGGKAVIVIAAVLVAVVAIGGIFYFTSDSYNAKKNLKLAEKSYEAGEYEKALEYCDAALELDDTAAEAYLKSAEVYRKEAEAYVEQGNYAEARNVLDRGNADTGDASLAERKVKTYRLESDHYLAAGNCVAAVEILMEGASVTGATELSEREDYLREKIVLVRREYSNGFWHEFEYDASGNETKHVCYYGNGSIGDWSEYDIFGIEIFHYDGSNTTTYTYEYRFIGEL